MSTTTKTAITVSIAQITKEFTYLAKLTAKPIVPVTEYVLATLSEGNLSLATTDLGTFLRVNSKALAPSSATQDTTMLLPAKTLLDYLKKQKGTEATITSTHTIDVDAKGKEIHTYKLDITVGARNVSLYSEHAKDFPEYLHTAKQLAKALAKYNADISEHTPFKEESKLYSGEYKEATDLFKKASTYLSSDTMRPAMCTTRFGKGSIAGINGHVAHLGTAKSTPEEDYILLPKATTQLLTLINPLNFEYAFAKNVGTIIYIENADVVCTIFTKPIDERFPDVENVIPTPDDTKYSLQLPVKTILEEVEMAKPFINKTTKALAFTTAKDTLHIHGEDLDFATSYGNEIEVTYTLNRYQKNEETGAKELVPLRIGLNTTYLTQVLKSLEEPIIELNLISYSKGMVFKTKNDLALLMPVILDYKQK